jgi:hypothetical protein
MPYLISINNYHPLTLLGKGFLLESFQAKHACSLQALSTQADFPQVHCLGEARSPLTVVALATPRYWLFSPVPRGNLLGVVPEFIIDRCISLFDRAARSLRKTRVKHCRQSVLCYLHGTALNSEFVLVSGGVSLRSCCLPIPLLGLQSLLPQRRFGSLLRW